MKHFVSNTQYLESCYRFASYNFIRTKDGKEPSQEIEKRKKQQKIPEWIRNGDFDPLSARKEKTFNCYKTPEYIKKGLQHPIHGGGCCPR